MRDAEFTAYLNDALADRFMGDTDTGGDCFVAMTVDEFAVDFALAWGEAGFVGDGWLELVEQFCEEGGDDMVMIIVFLLGGEMGDEVQRGVRFASGLERVGCCF